MSASEMKYVEGLINKMKVIQKILPPSPPRLLGFGSRQQALSSPGSSSGGASLLLKKRLTPTVLVLLAALVAGLLFLLPGGLLQAQETSSKTVEYTENDTSPVLTLSASDPEGAAPIIWSILEVVPDPAPVVGGTDLVRADSADFASFDISQSGVLTFKEEPSFEAKSPSIYKVVVVASDGNEDSYFKVTVNVQDEEEEGSVELRPTGQTLPTLLQPQVGVGITADNPTDPDGPDDITAITGGSGTGHRARRRRGPPYHPPARRVPQGLKLPTRRSPTTSATTFAWWRPTTMDVGLARWLRPSRNT